MTELLASHDLFFGTQDSEKIAASLKGINIELIRDYKSKWVSAYYSSHLSDFPIYGPRLQHIHQRMKDWRPVRFRDLRFRPYNDPVPYFAFLFGVFFGALAVVSIGLNVAQLVISINHR